MSFATTKGLPSPGLFARLRAIRARRQRILFVQPQDFSGDHNHLASSVKSYTTNVDVTSTDLQTSKAKRSHRALITGSRFLIPGRHPEDEDDVSRESDRRIQNILRENTVVPKLRAYRKAQAGGFKGTFFEYEVGVIGRSYRKNPEETPWITTLSLEEGVARGQFICFGLDKTNKRHRDSLKWKGYVLFGGQILGHVALRAGGSRYTFPPNEDVCPYILPGSYILRLRKRDGSDHEYQVDLRDGMFRPWCRTFADLAARQSLIEPIKTDGYLRSFDLRENLKAQYRILFIPQKPESLYHRGGVRLTPELETQDIQFSIKAHDIRQPPFPGIRGFFHIDSEGMMRLWDIDRARDVLWKANPREGFSTSWSAKVVKERWPELFAHAQRLGYWKAFS